MCTSVFVCVIKNRKGECVLSVCVCLYDECISVCDCKNVWVCVSLCASVFVCVCVCICKCVCEFVFVRMNVCVCKSVHVQVCL